MGIFLEYVKIYKVNGCLVWRWHFMCTQKIKRVNLIWLKWFIWNYIEFYTWKNHGKMFYFFVFFSKWDFYCQIGEYFDKKSHLIKIQFFLKKNIHYFFQCGCVSWWLWSSSAQGGWWHVGFLRWEGLEHMQCAEDYISGLLNYLDINSLMYVDIYSLAILSLIYNCARLV